MSSELEKKNISILVKSVTEECLYAPACNNCVLTKFLLSVLVELNHKLVRTVLMSVFAHFQRHKLLQQKERFTFRTASLLTMFWILGERCLGRIGRLVALYFLLGVTISAACCDSTCALPDYSHDG